MRSWIPQCDVEGKIREMYTVMQYVENKHNRPVGKDETKKPETEGLNFCSKDDEGFRPIVGVSQSITM